MNRAIALGTLVLVGALALAAAGLQAQRGQAGPTPAGLAAAKIEKVKDNLYMITGSALGDAFTGGNIGVWVTDTGVVVVDTKNAGYGQMILDRIKSVTDKPVTTIINTHSHGDHTGNNDFAGASVEIIAHENTKANMEKMAAFKDKSQFLPGRTYKDKLSIGTGKYRVDLYYFGPGHTSGDTWVVYPSVRTLHAGDMFVWKGQPVIDANNGGSGVQYPATLTKALTTIKNVDTIIPGHSPLMTWNDLKEYAQFNKDFLSWAEGEMKAGKTADEAAAEYKIPEKYKDYKIVPFGAGLKGNIQTIYNELKK
jgi:cyclase